jgi:hypothetical protein
MTDEEVHARQLKSEQEYGKEVSWSREKMLKASMAAATVERKWQGRHIIGWLDWVGVDKHRHAILVLDDGTRLRIHEAGAQQ